MKWESFRLFLFGECWDVIASWVESGDFLCKPLIENMLNVLILACNASIFSLFYAHASITRSIVLRWLSVITSFVSLIVCAGIFIGVLGWLVCVMVAEWLSVKREEEGRRLFYLLLVALPFLTVWREAGWIFILFFRLLSLDSLLPELIKQIYEISVNSSQKQQDFCNFRRQFLPLSNVWRRSTKQFNLIHRQFLWIFNTRLVAIFLSPSLIVVKRRRETNPRAFLCSVVIGFS